MAGEKDKTSKGEDKQKRLGDALRANLRKRKTQSRGRKISQAVKGQKNQQKDT